MPIVERKEDVHTIKGSPTRENRDVKADEDPISEQYELEEYWPVLSLLRMRSSRLP